MTTPTPSPVAGLRAGIHTMPAAEYHADPCPAPSLSCSIARLLVRRSPLHAHYAHPRLGGGDERDEFEVMDAGSIVHALLLGAGSEVCVVTATYDEKHKLAGQPVRDFATNAAKAERDAIRKAGGIPVLPHKLKEYEGCFVAIEEQMHRLPDCAEFFAAGQSEAVVIWQEGDLWLRAMIDRLPDDPRASPFDVKCTELSAAPGGWERRLQTLYAFQAAFYERGLRAVRGVQPGPMKFVASELDAPHGCAVMSAAPSLRMIAEAEVDRAIRIWAQCIKTNDWPGYPPFTAWVEAPNWMIAEAEARELRDEYAEEHAP